ncbi:peroxidase family protein [Engelhardtia mirabilis]|uniref:Peroxidase n=1 Tax=Engelhardtia mirabilis TaxID=2528011 RepID=A0A518BP64_9BACT|nr:peroxidase [Planctomycetes bacterium Pla133]QDV03073.1 peroxidase [Planctomycetes bacterium Pla86]
MQSASDWIGLKPAFVPPGSGRLDQTRWLEQRAEALLSAECVEGCIPAGYTYFGQFIVHDVSFHRPAIGGGKNRRSVCFDLDSVYGDGPHGSPHLYDDDDRYRLRIGHAQWNPRPEATPRVEWDLPRVGAMVIQSARLRRELMSSERYRELAKPLERTVGRLRHLPAMDGPWVRLVGGEILRCGSDSVVILRTSALIGDPRNDENVLVGQMHLAFLQLHNRLMQEARESAQNESDAEAFEWARSQVRLRFQHAILHDYLLEICSKEVVDRVVERAVTVLKGEAGGGSLGSLIREPRIPDEFALAGFRFGHAMVRTTYDLNARVRGIPILAPGAMVHPQEDLRGGKQLPPDWSVDWRRFFQVSDVDPPPQMAHGIAPCVDSRLGMIHDGGAPSLPARTLLAGFEKGLPSGQTLAKAIKAPVRGGEELPLWEYVLREAPERRCPLGARKHGDATGPALGPVGNTIVAETIVGILASDPSGIFRTVEYPEWRYEARRDYGILQLLEEAGVLELEPPMELPRGGRSSPGESGVAPLPPRPVPLEQGEHGAGQ